MLERCVARPAARIRPPAGSSRAGRRRSRRCRDATSSSGSCSMWPSSLRRVAIGIDADCASTAPPASKHQRAAGVAALVEGQVEIGHRGRACAPTGRLAGILALLRDRAVRAVGLARLADVAAEQDQPVVGVLAEAGGRRGDEAVLHGAGRLARGESRAIGDAEDVRVDGDRRCAEGRVQHHVGRLPAHARQRLEGRPVAGHLAAVLVQQQPGRCAGCSSPSC